MVYLFIYKIGRGFCWYDMFLGKWKIYMYNIFSCWLKCSLKYISKFPWWRGDASGLVGGCQMENLCGQYTLHLGGEHHTLNIIERCGEKSQVVIFVLLECSYWNNAAEMPKLCTIWTYWNLGPPPVFSDERDPPRSTNCVPWDFCWDRHCRKAVPLFHWFWILGASTILFTYLRSNFCCC